MSRMRSKMSKKNKWYIDPERYLELLHFCKQYNHMIASRKSFVELKSGMIKLEPTRKNCKPDPTAEIAIKIVSLDKRISLIEEAAKEASGPDSDMYEWLMMGITKDISYDNMYMIGIPCGKDYYYDCYHKFFYILDQKRD